MFLTFRRSRHALGSLRWAWCLVLVLLPLGLAGAEDAKDAWPRFRGPNGSAVATGLELPTQWNKENILWKVPVKGSGVSSPVVWGDKLFLTLASDRGKTRVIRCVNATTGKQEWEKTFKYASHKKHNENSFATATPVTDGESLVTVFTDPDKTVVYCFSLTGDKKWEKDFGSFAAHHGSGASPIIYNGLVILSNEQPLMSKDGKPHGPNVKSQIVALDLDNGDVKWKTPRNTPKAAYSTPFVYKGSEGDQLIVSSTAGLTAINPSNGKVIWTAPVLSARAVASPFQAGDLILANCGSGNRGKVLVAYKPTGQGDVASTHKAWSATKSLPYCVTPVATDEYVYLALDTGVMSCLDAKTGGSVWVGRLRGNIFASPILADDKIIVATRQGDVFTLAAGKKFKILHSTTLDDHFAATPAVANGKVYLRGDNYLWCLGKK